MPPHPASVMAKIRTKITKVILKVTCRIHGKINNSLECPMEFKYQFPFGCLTIPTYLSSGWTEEYLLCVFLDYLLRIDLRHILGAAYIVFLGAILHNHTYWTGVTKISIKVDQPPS